MAPLHEILKGYLILGFEEGSSIVGKYVKA